MPASRLRVAGDVSAGWPKALDEADLLKARVLLCSGDYTKVQVAKELEVSRHTLWRTLSQEATS